MVVGANMVMMTTKKIKYFLHVYILVTIGKLK
jgi:hypothetical protein